MLKLLKTKLLFSLKESDSNSKLFDNQGTQRSPVFSAVQTDRKNMVAKIKVRIPLIFLLVLLNTENEFSQSNSSF